ncbi:MAG: chromate transporter [Lentisphaerae bacterium]|nr:chromate transporter [Lentisphaerota bacterium]
MKIDREYFSRLWLLFWTFAKIAALVVGGGLAMLPVIEETFVNRKKILTSEELLDMIAITQTIPGIIAVNSAVYVGWKVAGLLGAVCATVGVILPSFTVIVIIAMFFPSLSPDNIYIKGAFSGVRAAITGMIAVTAYNTLRKGVKKRIDAVIVAAGFITCAIFKVNPAYVICAAMPAGLVLLYWEERKAGRTEK